MSGKKQKLLPPPAPTWRGSAPDASRRYAQFRAKSLEELRTPRLSELRRQIDRLHNQLEELRWSSQHLPGEVRALQRQIASHEARSSTSTIDAKAEARRIKQLPGVLGAKLTQSNSLAVLVRSIVKRGGRLYDFGDFEIVLERRQTFGYGAYDFVSVVCVRSGLRPGHEAAERYYTDNGWFQFTETQSVVLARSLSEGRVYDFLRGAIKAMHATEELSMADFKHYPEAPGRGPRAAWRGFPAGFDKLLAKSISDLKRNDSEMMRLKSALVEKRQRLQQFAVRARDLNNQLRGLQAEEQELSTVARVPVKEEVTARSELRYIQRLPGVIGVRFDEDGFPVFHVRTACDADERRWDMGDFEVRFGIGRFNIARTRSTHGGHLYASSASFCLGTQSDEIYDLYERSEYALFMHRLVYALNFVNENDREFLWEYYTEIPSESLPKSPRLRPRRRPKLGVGARPLDVDPRVT